VNRPFLFLSPHRRPISYLEYLSFPPSHPMNYCWDGQGLHHPRKERFYQGGGEFLFRIGPRTPSYGGGPPVYLLTVERRAFFRLLPDQISSPLLASSLPAIKTTHAFEAFSFLRRRMSSCARILAKKSFSDDASCFRPLGRLRPFALYFVLCRPILASSPPTISVIFSSMILSAILQNPE